MPAKAWHPVPAAVYVLVDQTPGTVLLEGAEPGQAEEESPEEPWTRLFMAPLRICVADTAGEVAALFGEIEQATAAGLSAAGFLSYECGSAFEPKAGMRPPRPGMPLAWFGIYERGYVFDHAQGRFVDGSPPGLDDARIASLVASLDDPVSIEARFALAEPEYARRIDTIHDLIRAGDVYQLNLTAPYGVHAAGSAAALYAHLRAHQPADYGAFVHWQQAQRILSFSPELFFRIDDEPAARRITTRPMKGTARRGRTTGEDREKAEWLRNDAKNRSENLMIVDLVRNDLGRVARFGTVRAEKLFSVQRLPTLWQMTSTITAELRGDAGLEEIFRSLFPCGSITGAPKVRAMQLIGELEDGPRGVYTGAIGFFSPRQTVFNVAIRTLELDGANGTMGVGSGIVIDSVAAAEFRECLLKAEFLTQAGGSRPQDFSLVESILWDEGFPLIELHLHRLADSAEYFGWRCDRATVEAALEAHAKSFTDGRARKVRLLLSSAGELRITDEPLAASTRAAVVAGRPSSDGTGRVRLATERTDPADPMLFHKTTHRPVYARAFQQASSQGFDDVLFLNTRGELTEGAISNVFIEKDGRWFTPRLDCGLLPGVFRRHMLQMRPEIEECVLSEDDFRSADAIYLTNAVRGLRRVALAEG